MTDLKNNEQYFDVSFEKIATLSSNIPTLNLKIANSLIAISHRLNFIDVSSQTAHLNAVI